MVIKYSLFSLLLFCCLSACTKISETNIGTGLIPPVDGVVTKDTDIVVYTKNQSNIDTVKPALTDDHILGYVDDPLFGSTVAAVNLQLLPTSYPFSFGAGSNFVLDSVVLRLAVRSVWGDTTLPLFLHVKEIDNMEDFRYDSTSIRYNNTTKFVATDDITYNGIASVYPYTLNDNFNFHQYADSGVNMLSVRLTQEFGNRLLNLGSTAYSTDSIFRTVFKGFQIYADSTGSGSSSLVSIGISNSSTGIEANTKLGIYYRYVDSAGNKDTAVRYFTPSNTSAHSNYISRNYSTGKIASYYPPSANLSDDYLYMQSGPGTVATIRIDSGITHLPNWIIHRAEIVMEQAPDDITYNLDTLLSPLLFMVVKDSNDKAFITDTTKFVIPGFHSTDVNSSSDALFSVGSNNVYVLSNYGDFGGIPYHKYNSEGRRINYYNFNLSRYVQGIVTNHNPLYKLTLFAPYRQLFRIVKDVNTYAAVSTTPPNTAGIGRIRLYGGGTDTTNTHRMKLHIVYSIPH